MFRPTVLAPDYRFHFDAPVEEHFLDTPDGARLNALLFPATVQANGRVVLYFHGNRDNLQRWGAMHYDFTQLGFDFFAPDYRGYGKSTGDHDEARYLEDAELAYHWLRQKYRPEDIVLYGRSLGSGMASHLAARVPARMLILETPFDNMRGLLASHVRRHEPPFEPAFLFPNDENLQKTSLPLLIFHGTRDRVVPFASASNLKKVLKPGDEFVTLEGGSHGNLNTYPAYQERLRTWLERVDKS
ncbi:MAG: alpha/beta hydrolase [Saprospiraceae bacterium]